MDAASTTATMIQNERRRMVSRSSRPATRRMLCHELMPAPRIGSSSARVLAGGGQEQLRQARCLDGEVEHLDVGAHGVEHAAGVGAGLEAQAGAGRVGGDRRRGLRVDPSLVHRDVDAQVAVGAAGLQRAHVAVEHDPTVVDEGDRLAEVLDEIELVAREEQVPPRADVVEDHRGQELHRRGVEAGEGLVEHEQVRLVDHRRRQLHPLRHAAGEVLDLVPAPVTQPEALEEVRRPAEPGGLVEAMEAGQPDELVQHPHVPVQAALLGHVAPRATVVVVGGTAAPLHDAGVGWEHAEQDPHERRLAGAVRSEQPDHATGRHLEVDVVEHHPLAEPLADAPRAEGVSHRGSLPGGCPCSHFERVRALEGWCRMRRWRPMLRWSACGRRTRPSTRSSGGRCSPTAARPTWPTRRWPRRGPSCSAGATGSTTPRPGRGGRRSGSRPAS